MKSRGDAAGPSGHPAARSIADGPILDKARTQAKSGRPAEAAETLRQFLKQKPQHAEAWFELGRALQQARKWHEAATAFQSVVSLQPRNANALYQMGAALLEAGRIAEAEIALSDAIASKPEFAEALVLLGRIQERLSKPEAAIAFHRKAIECAPRFVKAHFQLGRMLRTLRRFDEAIAAYEEAVRYAPSHADAHNNLGMILKTLGRSDEAIAAFRRAVAAVPSHHLALCNLGNTLWEIEELDGAAAAYQACIAAAPSYVHPYTNMANIRRVQFKTREAAELARRAVEIDPRDARAHAALACVHYAQGDYDKAKPLLAQALKLDVHDAETLCALADACRDCDQVDDALTLYRRVCALKPDYAAAHNKFGLMLQAMGDLAGAQNAYRSAIRVAPNFGLAHGNLAKLTKFREHDDHLRAMESLLQRDSLPPMQRAAVMFGIAKAFDDLGDYDKSFECLHLANRFRQSLLPPALQKESSHFNATMMKRLNASFFDRVDDAGDSSAVPILIVGMPRSGTTLVEQILASHSQVHGAGELVDLSRICGDWIEQVGASTFPDHASEISAQDLRRRGGQYVAALRRHSSDARYVTDKQPFNFAFLGFLKLIVPNAKIIHCKRDPVDTCISSYKRNFNVGMTFSYDLRELGRYYNSYRRLMDHWRTVLPGAMFEIQYEDLVADQENKTRELLSYCALPWEEGCLNFHEKERAVRTPSFAQVRQPIYKTSVASSRKYFPYIRPLLETLGIDADASPAD